MNNIAILVSDFINDELICKYQRIQSRFEGDTVLLLHDENRRKWNLPNNVNCCLFSLTMLNKLQYQPICDTIIPGSNHFALLWFYLENPEYMYYWNIEDDVDFTGDWAILFDEFACIKADFISSHIMNYQEDPYWYWWKSLECNIEIPLEERIRSFNPIYRISSHALSFLNSFLKSGNRGHHEVLIPSILYHFKYKIIDFGGEGRFVPTGFEDKFYLSTYFDHNISGGSMRFRPLFNKVIINELSNKLVHPLKLNF